MDDDDDDKFRSLATAVNVGVRALLKIFMYSICGLWIVPLVVGAGWGLFGATRHKHSELRTTRHCWKELMTIQVLTNTLIIITYKIQRDSVSSSLFCQDPGSAPSSPLGRPSHGHATGQGQGAG